MKEIHDVDIITTTPINGHVLGFDGTLWVNKTVAGWLGFTPVPETRTLTINGTTQDLSADRTFTIATGLTVGTTAITSGTVGRVLFQATGNVLQQSANFFWDNTNSRLGIGTATPSYGLDVRSTSNIQVSSGSYASALRVENTGSASVDFKNVATFIGNRGNAANIDDNTNIGIQQKNNTANNYAVINFFNSAFNLSAFLGTQFVNHASPTAHLILGTANSGTVTEKMRIVSNGNVLINTTTDGGYKLDVNGTARVSGLLTAGSNVNLAGSILYLNQGGASTSYVRNNASITILNGPQISLSGGTVSITATTNGANSDASAILDVQSTAKGVLFPRMTTTQKNAIASPASGLVVYDTTLGKLCVRGAAAWETITSI
jgi:hypothetical protein